MRDFAIDGTGRVIRPGDDVRIIFGPGGGSNGRLEFLFDDCETACVDGQTAFVAGLALRVEGEAPVIVQ